MPVDVQAQAARQACRDAAARLEPTVPGIVWLCGVSATLRKIACMLPLRCMPGVFVGIQLESVMRNNSICSSRLVKLRCHTASHRVTAIPWCTSVYSPMRWAVARRFAVVVGLRRAERDLKPERRCCRA
eukprot:365318-Chlamydomonas_euryale.AAC.9